MDVRAHAIEIEFAAAHATGATRLARRRGILVEVGDGDVTGWGEFVELPGYWHETNETALAALEGNPVIHSNPMAVGALEMAHADFEARRAGVPLAVELGGRTGAIEVGATVARLGNMQATVGDAARLVESGYRKLKVKIAPGFDAEPLRAVRESHPDLTLAADANGTYPVGTGFEFVDQCQLAYLEQPFPANAQWTAFAELRSRLRTPIALDESITTIGTVRSAVATGAADYLAVKPARLAGLAAVATIADLARAAGLGLIAGGLLETGVGRGHLLAMASLPGFAVPGDLSPPGEYLAHDIVAPAWTAVDGVVTIPDRAGIGVEVDRNALTAVTTTTVMVGAGQR